MEGHLLGEIMVLSVVVGGDSVIGGRFVVDGTVDDDGDIGGR